MRESDVSRMPGKRRLGGNLVHRAGVFQKNLAVCKCKSGTGEKKNSSEKVKIGNFASTIRNHLTYQILFQK